MVKDFPLFPLEKIAREAGAERVSRSALVALKEVLLEESETIARESVKLAEHAKRVTVKREDIVLASKR
ncbi:MAG: NFYB/HAP3 family transcription factor subunit [Candidatus Aenigmarchaeota archaeon]|nr:NFYB/HAP3 family transcription factor subunit [Candidatus Aenigmarchaeota archaeon]